MMTAAEESRSVGMRRREVERTIGRTFVRFEPCRGGNQSENFKAETDGDTAYFVKFVPSAAVSWLCGLYAGIDTPLVPGPLCHGEDWIVFPWRNGRNVHPADMTEGQLESVIRAAEAFNRATDGRKHGDFHCRNFLFEGEEVTTVCDLERMQPGAPVDDVLRVFVHALERARFWHRREIRSVLAKLSFAVAHSPWSQAEWLASVDRYESHKLGRRQQKKSGWMVLIDCRLRAGLYRRLRDAVTRAPACGNT